MSCPSQKAVLSFFPQKRQKVEEGRRANFSYVAIP